VLGVRIPPGLPFISLSDEVRKVIAKTRSFFDEVKQELDKVTWPTRKETVATTWVVVFIVVVISFYLGACDLILAKLLRLFIS
jgi:preprotein translocase subunit SecE